MTQPMTGRVAIEAHKMLEAIVTAMGRGGDIGKAAELLRALHDAGYDVIRTPSIALVPGTDKAAAE